MEYKEEKTLEIRLNRVDCPPHDQDDIQRPSRTLRRSISLEEHSKIMLDYVNGNDTKLPLKMKDITGKGRGIVTTAIIPKESFVVEYVGELISGKKAKEKELKYSTSTKNIGSYMFFFRHNDKTLCIDASEESSRIGRLINHSKSKANIRPKVIVYQDFPRIVFISTRIIEEGEELLYNYADQRKESTNNFPFLKY